MKIKGSGSLDPSLIEQMQRAHKQAKTDQTQSPAGAFSLEKAPAPTETTAPKPAASPGVDKVAQRVIDGEIKGPEEARKEVLVALVDERFDHMIEPSTKRKTLSMLEASLVDDPAFAKEVDHMLLLAARDLGTR